MRPDRPHRIRPHNTRPHPFAAPAAPPPGAPTTRRSARPSARFAPQRRREALPAAAAPGPRRALALLVLLACAAPLPACRQSTTPTPVAPFPPGNAYEYAPGVTGPVETLSVPGPGGQDLTFRYQVIDGLAVYQGDIILGTAAELARMADAAEIDLQGSAFYSWVCWTFLGIDYHCESYRWPNAVVPYSFQDDWDDPATADDENATMRARIRDAMDLVEGFSIVRFVPRGSQGDYVRLRNSKGCSAIPGREGGQQYASLSINCGEWAIAHELLHVLGLHHEHSRHDRDSYVEVLEQNIEPGWGFAFDSSEYAFDFGPYDYDSLMHYGPTAWCKADASKKCVGTTIETIPPGIAIGQSNHFSAGDKATVNALYPGLPPTLAITSPTGGETYSRRASNVFLAAAVTDPEGMAVSVTWTGDRAGPLGSGTDVTIFSGDLAYGTHVVTARAVDLQGNVATDSVSFAVVNVPPQVSITHPQPGPACVGEPVVFTADVLDVNEVGGALPESAVTWRVAGSSPFATGTSVTHAFGSSGSVQVVVRATDPFGAYAEDAVTLSVDPCTDLPPVVSILSPAGDVELPFDGYDTVRGQWYTEVHLVGSATDPEDGALDGASVRWTTDRGAIQPTLLGTGSSLTVRLYSDSCSGVTHTITFAARDSDGNIRTVIRTIRIWSLC